MKKFLKKLLDNSSKIAFVFLSASLITVLYSYGATLNTVKYKSELVPAYNYIKHADVSHMDVTPKKGETINYQSADKVCYDLYARRFKLHPYCETDSSFAANYNGVAFNPTLSSSPVYNDTDFTEYLNLPLYLPNRSIKKGPLYGAQYASYIPSSVADLILESTDFNTYDELLNSSPVFTLAVKNLTFTLSINNIYLNNETTHWNKSLDSIEDKYYLTFSFWNPCSIFLYSTYIYDVGGRATICFDFDSSYSHIEEIVKKCYRSLETNVDFTISNDGKDSCKLNINRDEMTNTYTSKSQIIHYVCFAIILGSQVLIVVLFEEVRKHLLGPAIASCAGFFIVAIVFEIIKSVLYSSSKAYLMFNAIGSAAALYYLIMFVVLAIFFRESKEEKNEKKSK